MLYGLSTNAAGLAAYLDVMGDDPCGYLGDGTANACKRLARLLHRISRVADVADGKLFRVRSALSRPFIRWQERAA